ncbi:iron-containing redox enzyme family protein [Leucobacter sp. USCH14]|uniref:iron-containing redox enzyme family protein n=1 Tax=Leucobacter sp. USCH14 TaxID=3024838 RepID=UPI0030AD06C3
MSVTVDTPSPLLALQPRGPVSEALLQRLSGVGEETGASAAPEAARRAVGRSESVTYDEDIQLALFLLYACFYGSLEGISADAEWDTALIETRSVLEAAFEAELRERIQVSDVPDARARDVAKALFDLTSADSGPSLSRYFAKRATEEQAREFLMQKSIYTLREADPHSWAIPRLRGGAKAALVEIQADEYGGGRPDRVHATIYAKTMRGAGLDDTYGGYLGDVPAITLASHNMMSMFGLNRRLVGAIVGHLAAFEMTSAIPNRLYGDGFRRLGYGEDVTDYFDEHVEADAVHEQIAGRDMAGALAEDRPELLHDIMFGAAACLTVDGWMGQHMLESWTDGRSSLRAGAAA